MRRWTAALLLLLLLLVALGARARARAGGGGGGACSPWAGEEEGAASDWERCRRCLRARFAPLPASFAVRDAEVVLRKNQPAAPRVCKLWAENCSIEVVSSAAFNDLLCLQRLFLQNNAIVQVHPLAFSNDSELQHLDLRGNKLALPRNSIFIRSVSIRILDLSFNDIDAIHSKTFAGTPNVSALHLRGNKIREMNRESFLVLTRLQFLDMVDNFLTRIDFVPPAPVFCVYVGGNPVDSVLPHLRDVNADTVFAFSRNVCCCGSGYCNFSAGEWVSRCEKCEVERASTTPRISSSTRNTTTNTAIASTVDGDSATLRNYTAQATVTYFARTLPTVKSERLSRESKDKDQIQFANITVILLSSVFSFLILIQSSIIVFLLVKSRRRNIVPTYAVVDIVTDLDDESYGGFNPNPIYESIAD